MERGRCESTRRILAAPDEPEAWRALARLASRTNQWEPALEWWKKVDEANRLTVEDRRDYVGAALVAGEVTLAAKQVEILMAQRAPAAIDLMLAGQLALAIAILFWHSIMPNACSRIKAQNRLKFSPLQRSFSR